MLQEILLSLAGHPSPLLENLADGDQTANPDFPLISPPERALLDSLAHLGRLYRQVRSATTILSSSHPSTICRAVAGNIASDHLGKFQQKVLDVEKSILQNDAGYVGGYGIVPLSTIVGEFSEWTRRIEWLWRIVQFMNPALKMDVATVLSSACNGSSLINYLRMEHSQTGYVDIEEISADLMCVSDMAWLRQISTWILYGRLPSFGADDFFIKEQNPKRGDGPKDFRVHADLLPSFVSPSCASSILFIGKSLYHLRQMPVASKHDNGLSDTALLSAHLRELSSITPPINSSTLVRVIDSIRKSLSQNALSRLLSARRIMDLLSVLRSFLLLDNGEFVVALVNRADEQLNQRLRSSGGRRKVKQTKDALEELTIKDGETAAVLTQVLADLSSLQGEDDDEEVDMAHDLLKLSISDSRTAHSASEEAKPAPFHSFLFPVPTTLSVRIQPPLDLFLELNDLDIYSTVNGYLLSIRRAHLHLSDLWKHTSLRREHPAPLGPPLSNSKGGATMMERRRKRSNERTITMRKVWASTAGILFLLSELGLYLQGEVVNGHWKHFRQWLAGSVSPSNSRSPSRPGTSSTIGDSSPSRQSPKPVPRDPETVTAAHRAYLSALVASLFLDDKKFTEALKISLSHIDHFIALLTRLQTVQQNLDLEADEGVVDALVNYASEEEELAVALKDARTALDSDVKSIIEALREVEEKRHGTGFGVKNLGGGLGQDDTYVPWKGPSVDRLLMKIDFGRVDVDDGTGEVLV